MLVFCCIDGNGNWVSKGNSSGPLRCSEHLPHVVTRRRLAGEEGIQLQCPEGNVKAQKPGQAATASDGGVVEVSLQTRIQSKPWLGFSSAIVDVFFRDGAIRFANSFCFWIVYIYIVRHTDQAKYCEALAKKIASVTDLPDKCKNYDAVKEILQKRKTITDPFAGMKGATSARAMRATGQESHAQIQRRMTTGATIGTRRFSKLDKDT